MAAKYPSIPFTMEEVFCALLDLEEALAEWTIRVLPRPTKACPGRLCIVLDGFRTTIAGGKGLRYERKTYVEPGKPCSLDRTVYLLVLDASRELGIETEAGGRYTSLFPGWSPRE